MPDEQDPQTVRTETTNEQVAAALARQSTLLRLVAGLAEPSVPPPPR